MPKNPKNMPIQAALNRDALHSPKDNCGIGFVAHIKNKKSHSVVENGLQILEKLTHRGACGCEENTGDGAGVLLQVPDKFFRKVVEFSLPTYGQYGVGFVFLPKDKAQADQVKKAWDVQVKKTKLEILGWRKVPVDNSNIGPTAAAVEPDMEQVFIGLANFAGDQEAFERRLYLLRKRCDTAIKALGLAENVYYVPSLSTRMINYKGMLTPHQLRTYFKDLQDKNFESALAMVHSRFATNTFPAWDLGQPFRYLCHNGEINTLRGNANWMAAREAIMQSELFPGDEIKDLRPICTEGASDSANLDNVFELLVLGGRSLPHAMMMMIPEAWSKHESMPQNKKDFYQYHSCLMEPWDGPASVAFTDGKQIGATLDRNGLRPSRFYITKDDLCIMASEVGVLPVKPEDVVRKGRLEPGRMFLIDLEKGQITEDAKLKKQISDAHPYGQWLKKNLLTPDDLPDAPPVPRTDHYTLLRRQVAFGYTHEDLKLIVGPMARDGKEPTGSMGNDEPHAVLSDKPQLLFNYFKQLFAQVTNPPLDSIREWLVTSVTTTIGPEGDLLHPGPENCRQIELRSPVLSNEEFAKFDNISHDKFKSVTLRALFKVSEGAKGLAKAMKDLRRGAAEAVRDGHQIVILSDRGMDEQFAPIPSLLACAGVHHHLIREGLRTQAGLVIESGQPREVHHFALLVGYGAQAINPYNAFDSIDDMIRRNAVIGGMQKEKAVKNFIKAANTGIVKTMSKIGISTVQSYRGAQIFEAIGLKKDFIDEYFTATASRIEGVGIEEIARETLERHAEAFTGRKARPLDLDYGGRYQWRREGERHLMDAKVVSTLQHAVMAGDYKKFKTYTHLVDNQESNMLTLRGLLSFKKGARKPISIDEVEPASEIVKRFTTGAMSYGSISQEAHETIAIGMNRLGAKSNTGEGGEDPVRFVKMSNGDSKRSAIKQVASGRFGVTSEYLVNSDQVQIKIAQGAKPGEGGALSGKKVWPWIAKTRYSTPFVGLISPPPHHDIYSIEDLAQLIFDLKNASGSRISVKLVSEVGVGTIASGVTKAHADHILISGHDGGTGNSPLSSIKYAGGPWELGLAETHQVLVEQGLRDRVMIETDGQLRTGRDVVIAAMLGAEEYGFGTVTLVTTGCIMMRVCHLDTCPVGVATQNPELREKFTGKPEYVVNFMTYVAENAREWMAELGFKSVNEMIGQAHDNLEIAPWAKDHWKTRGINYDFLLRKPIPHAGTGLYKTREQDHGLETILDNRILKDAAKALDNKEKVELNYDIHNTDRTVGTMFGAELTRRHGGQGLPADTVTLNLKGSAGQSLGAWLPAGVTIKLEGDANDYVGKGLSGGKIIVRPPLQAKFIPEENIIVGNVLLYGATSGEAYFRGIAGERFCVRNSGAYTVVEGLGDHGCEYMTGGQVVVLGKTGRNFAAGMSGGVAYIYDADDSFKPNCNTDMVAFEDLSDAEDNALVKGMITRHKEYTGSTVAENLLKDWEVSRGKFVKVMPVDYKRALEELKKIQKTAKAGT